MLLFFLGGRVHLYTPIYLPNLHILIYKAACVCVCDSGHLVPGTNILVYLYSCQGILNFKKPASCRLPSENFVLVCLLIYEIFCCRMQVLRRELKKRKGTNFCLHGWRNSKRKMRLSSWKAICSKCQDS